MKTLTLRQAIRQAIPVLRGELSSIWAADLGYNTPQGKKKCAHIQRRRDVLLAAIKRFEVEARNLDMKQPCLKARKC